MNGTNKGEGTYQETASQGQTPPEVLSEMRAGDQGAVVMGSDLREQGIREACQEESCQSEEPELFPADRGFRYTTSEKEPEDQAIGSGICASCGCGLDYRSQYQHYCPDIERAG